MRKIILILFVGALIFSCSNDDNGLAITEENLLGKWYLKGGTVDNGPFEDYEHNCSESKDFQEFFANGDLTFNGYNSSCNLSEVETSHWILSGTTLTVTTGSFEEIIQTDTFTVEEISSNRLILKRKVTLPDGEFVYRIHATRN